MSSNEHSYLWAEQCIAQLSFQMGGPAASNPAGIRDRVIELRRYHPSCPVFEMRRVWKIRISDEVILSLETKQELVPEDLIEPDQEGGCCGRFCLYQVALLKLNRMVLRSTAIMPQPQGIALACWTGTTDCCRPAVGLVADGMNAPLTTKKKSDVFFEVQNQCALDFSPGMAFKCEAAWSVRADFSSRWSVSC
jgi:hypothetical protein